MSEIADAARRESIPSKRLATLLPIDTPVAGRTAPSRVLPRLLGGVRPFPAPGFLALVPACPNPETSPTRQQLLPYFGMC
jgi:hypothetical protein